MWENRFLYTGADLQEAYDKAQQDVDTINANLSQAVGRPICIQSHPDINTAFPVIEGQIAYCNIVKPLPYWIEHYNAMNGVDNYYAEAIYNPSWVLPDEE